MATKMRSLGEMIDEAEPMTHPNLNAALIAAQAEFAAPRKDREVTVRMKNGGSYKFSYATMAGMLEGDKPILAKHGLGFVQFAAGGCMVTRILHASGEHMDCPLPMLNLPNAPQEAGSVITYFKRYSYAAAFGRVADEEDDANIAQGNDYTPSDRAPKSNGAITPAQRDELLALAERAGVETSRLSSAYGVTSVADIPAAKFERAVASLKRHIQEPA